MTKSDTPRSLVYKDIEKIKDVLGNSSETTLEREFYNRLEKRPFIMDSDNPSQLVLTIFNNARYIYYLVICEEDYYFSTFKSYMSYAAESVDGTDLKCHITAATIALVYNWLDSNSCDISRETDISDLKEKIYLHFSEEKKGVTTESIMDFHDLLLKKHDLPTVINELFDNIRDIEEAAQNAPIQDVANGIDYLIDCYDPQNGTNGEKYLFLNNILKRFCNEKTSAINTDDIEKATVTIRRTLHDLELAPEPEPFISGLSLDNLIKVPDNWDGDINTLIGDIDNSSEKDSTIQEEPQQTEEWDSRYDGFLKENLNAQAIYEVLQNINSPHLPKNERPYWWVFYSVLVDIRWATAQKGNQRLILKWANHHFNCGWDWNKANQFKFTDINPTLKGTPINQWDENTMATCYGLYYRELAEQMKSTFVEIVNGDKLMDKKRYIKEGFLRINNGH